MSIHPEFEVKILEINTEKVVARLQELHATQVFDGQLVTDFFRNAAGLKMRLRRMGGKIILTHKIKQANNSVAHNEEIEITVDNYEATRRLLEVAGFSQFGHSEKSRTSYQLGQIQFDIDTLPNIPTLVEVEADNEADVQKGVELLGYTMAQTCTLTERKLKAHYGIAP